MGAVEAALIVAAIYTQIEAQVQCTGDLSHDQARQAHHHCLVHDQKHCYYYTQEPTMLNEDTTVIGNLPIH